MKIKPTQIYDWDSEPVDERPSEFSHSASHSPVSGFYSTPRVTRRPPKPSGAGFTGLFMVALTLLALGALALATLAPLLRG